MMSDVNQKWKVSTFESSFKRFDAWRAITDFHSSLKIVLFWIAFTIPAMLQVVTDSKTR